MHSELKQNYTVFKWSLDYALCSLNLKVFFPLKSQSRNYTPVPQTGKMSPMISFSSQQLLPAPSCKWRKLQKAQVSAEGVRSSRRAGAGASGEGDPIFRSRGVQQARLLPTAGLGSSLPKPHSQGLTLQKAGEISSVISGNSKHPLFSCCCADRQGRCQGT